jgi:hypothetical protein
LNVRRRSQQRKALSPPRQGFSLSKELVTDEGFPPHIVGFMRRKREKEQDKRDEQPSQS